MGHEYDCKKAQKDIFSDDEACPEELTAHLEACPECKEQFEKARAMRLLVKKSAPDVPDIRTAVLERIKNENISPAPKKSPRRKLPLGTLTAAAAVLVIYLSANGGILPDMMNRDASEEDFEYVTTDSAPEVADFETYSTETAYSGNAGAGGGSPKEKYSSENSVFFSDSKADGTQYARIEEAEAVPEACTEDCAEDAPVEKQVENYDGAEQEASASVNDSITGALTDTESYDVELYADELFKKLSHDFPGRIPEEAYKKAGPDVFVRFVDTVSDFETQYTEKALLEFAEKNAK